MRIPINPLLRSVWDGVDPLLHQHQLLLSLQKLILPSRPQLQPQRRRLHETGATLSMPHPHLLLQLPSPLPHLLFQSRLLPNQQQPPPPPSRGSMAGMEWILCTMLLLLHLLKIISPLAISIHNSKCITSPTSRPMPSQCSQVSLRHGSPLIMEMIMEMIMDMAWTSNTICRPRICMMNHPCGQQRLSALLAHHHPPPPRSQLPSSQLRRRNP